MEVDFIFGVSQDNRKGCFMRRYITGFSVVVMCLFACQANAALDFDFAGTFTYDNDVALLNFTVGETSTVTIFSSSWDDGGFDPILAIWNSAGALVNEQDDGHNVGSTMSNGVWYDHGNWDSYYDVNLTAGSYTASIAQFSNFAVGSSLSDGFTYDDNPNFTFDLGYGAQPYFNGVQSSTDARTGDWVFHILNVEEATGPGPQVPEPATFVIWSLLGVVGIGAGCWRRRKTA